MPRRWSRPSARCARGTTLILSSHQMWQIENVCSEFCIISAGQVRTHGSLAGLRASFPTRTVRVAPDTTAIRAVFRGIGDAADAPRDGAAAAEAAFVVPAGTDFGALLRAAVAAGPLTTFDRSNPRSTHLLARHRGRAGRERGLNALDRLRRGVLAPAAVASVPRVHDPRRVGWSPLSRSASRSSARLSPHSPTRSCSPDRPRCAPRRSSFSARTITSKPAWTHCRRR